MHVCKEDTIIHFLISLCLLQLHTKHMTQNKSKLSPVTINMADTFENTEQTDARFQKFATAFSDTFKQNEQLRAVIKTLQADLKTCRATCDFLKREISEKLTNESETVHHTKLLTKIKDLEAAAALQKEEEKKVQMQLEEEKFKLLDELNREKEAHVTTELKLTNDLQLANNVAAIQYDELELKMQERVGNLVTQLKETNNKCNMFRSEIFSLKQKLANSNADEKIKRLEEKLRFTEEQLKIAQNSVQQEQSFRGGFRAVENENNGESTKYNSIKIVDYDKERFANPAAFKTNVSFNQCHVTEKQTRNMRRSGNTSGFPLPPLKEIGQSSPKTGVKKRKLLNPDDLSYLEGERQD